MAVICRACRPAVVAVEMYAVLNPPEEARSYSSVWDNNAIGTGHGRSMLHSPQAWVSLTNTIGQHMTISLGSAQTVVGVITQGRAECCPQWVSSYKVQASQDCTTYIDVDGTARLATTPAWIRFRQHRNSPRRAGLPHRWEIVWREFRQPLESFELLHRTSAGNAIYLQFLFRQRVGTFRSSSSGSCSPFETCNRRIRLRLQPRKTRWQRTTTCSLRIAQPLESFCSLMCGRAGVMHSADAANVEPSPYLPLHICAGTGAKPSNLQWDRLNPANPHCD